MYVSRTRRPHCAAFVGCAEMRAIAEEPGARAERLEGSWSVGIGPEIEHRLIVDPS
ncbi:hypothetical protein [Streptomyces spectabilis]|uniref:hypothetical protein n=1 Tax=Streptomyces spectabilis TaxID=68270 RepID=UPI001CEFAF06|nr:hypothetical protein [Streptomyces spectabilis]